MLSTSGSAQMRLLHVPNISEYRFSSELKINTWNNLETVPDVCVFFILFVRIDYSLIVLDDFHNIHNIYQNFNGELMIMQPSVFWWVGENMYTAGVFLTDNISDFLKAS